MDASGLRATIESVIVEVCPADLDLYKIEADVLIREAIEGRSTKALEGDVQPRFSLPEILSYAETAADYIKIIAATVQSLRILGFIRTKPKISVENLTEIQKSWKEQLEKAGLAEKEAALISMRFSHELLKVAGG